MRAVFVINLKGLAMNFLASAESTRQTKRNPSTQKAISSEQTQSISLIRAVKNYQQKRKFIYQSIAMIVKPAINRRNFLLQSAFLFPGSLFAMQRLTEVPASKYKMGLQLFSIREPLSKDVFGTIKQVAAIGYEDCETYGYDPAGVKYYGLKAADFKQLLTDHNLITTSGHYDLLCFLINPLMK